MCLAWNLDSSIVQDYQAYNRAGRKSVTKRCLGTKLLDKRHVDDANLKVGVCLPNT